MRKKYYSAKRKLKQEITNKDKDLKGNMASQGTTPQKIYRFTWIFNGFNIRKW